MANLLVVIQKNQKMIFIKKNSQEIILQPDGWQIFYGIFHRNYFNKYVTASDSKVKLSCSPMLH